MTMAEERANSREGLSLQTLVVAAVASGVAAIIVSHVWQGGTVLAAAMTPVFVSIFKEVLRRPIESDVVRRSASKVSKVATSALPTTAGSRGGTPPGGRPSAPTSTLPPRPSTANGNGNGNGDVVVAGPRRTYGSDGRETRTTSGWRERMRGPRMRLAVVTGLLAFVIAVAALTLPELIFGGSVTSSGGRTTIFGGSGSGSASKDKKANDQKSDKNGSDGSTQDNSSQQDDGSTQPQDSGDEPTATTPSQTQSTPTQPEATQPQQTQPAPSGGSSPVPPAPVPTPPTP
jgi:hypothetical protein